MLLIDATTAEHARGIRTVVLAVVGALPEESRHTTAVVAGPKTPLPTGVTSRRVAIAGSRPGRLMYQRLLLPLDAQRIRGADGRVDRLLLLDAYAPVLRRRDNARYAALVHDMLPLSHPHYWPLSKRLVKRVAFASLRRDVTLFTSTEFNAGEIKRLIGMDARLVRFGCGQLDDNEADEALEAPLPDRRPYLVYVGAIEPRKGLLTLLDAFDIVAGEVDLGLLILGDGGAQFEDVVRRRMRNSPYADRIEIRSRTGREELLRLVAEASALAMPSRAEGFGLPILEALALGTPVVASDIQAFRSWAEDAVLFARPDEPEEWAETLEAALAADDDARRRGQMFARAFRWRACAAQLVDF